MALFAAIGDRFIAKILKQVAHDYKLDFEDMKSRYLSEPKTPEAPKAPKVIEAPGAPLKAERPKKVSEPKKASDENKPMAISKMKKPDLIAECNARGLDSEGTVAQLKERVKEARAAPPPPVEEVVYYDENDEPIDQSAIPVLPAEYLNPFTNKGEYSNGDYVILILDHEIAVTTYQEPEAIGAYLKLRHDQTGESLLSGTVTGKHYVKTGVKIGEVPNEDLDHYVMK